MPKKIIRRTQHTDMSTEKYITNTDDSNLSMDDFKEEMDRSFKKISEGDIIKGQYWCILTLSFCRFRILRRRYYWT